MAAISVAQLRTELAEIFEARSVALSKEALKYDGDRTVYAIVASELKYMADLIREGLHKGG